MALDFSKVSSALFLDLVNTKSKRALAAAELTIGAAAAGTSSKNTTVHLSAAEDAANLVNEADFHYDRLDLATVFTGKVLTVAVTGENPTTLTVAAALNAKYKLGIGAEDITSAPIDTEAKPESVTLTALATGLVYTGSVAVALTYAKDDLSTLMGDGVADGFVAPDLSEV